MENGIESRRNRRIPRAEAPRGLAAAVWDISIVLAQFSAWVVLGYGILALPRLEPSFAKRIGAILPEPIVRLFESDRAIADPNTLQAIESRIAEDLIEPVDASHRRKTFGMGSNKEDVLSAQGQPDASRNNVWLYGASEVYFVADRVVGWHDSPGDPLKLH